MEIGKTFTWDYNKFVKTKSLAGNLHHCQTYANRQCPSQESVRPAASAAGPNFLSSDSKPIGVLRISLFVTLELRVRANQAEMSFQQSYLAEATYTGLFDCGLIQHTESVQPCQKFIFILSCQQHQTQQASQELGN